MIGLICGVPPLCDRCHEEDAKVQIELPFSGERRLCEECVIELMQLGLEREASDTLVIND